MKILGKRSVSSFLFMLLSAAWYFVAVALGLTVAVIVMSPRLDLGGAEVDIPVSFSVDARALPLGAPSLGVDTAQIDNARGSLKFQPPARRSLLAPLALVIVMLGVTLWTVGLLRAIVRTIRDGQPFAPGNATRIRWIAFVVILGEIARSAAVFAANRFAMTHFTAEGLRLNARPDLNVAAIVYGLIILVIAEAFRAGTRLDEDRSLTI